MKAVLIIALIFIVCIQTTSSVACWLDSYDRGEGESVTCDTDEEEYKKDCYPQCKTGYHGVGPICWQGVRSYSRGDGHSMKCADGLKQSGTLCYTACKAGYSDVGSICWETCSPGYKKCGALCLKDQACANKTLSLSTLGAHAVATSYKSGNNTKGTLQAIKQVPGSNIYDLC